MPCDVLSIVKDELMSLSPGCFMTSSFLAYGLNLDFLASDIHHRLHVLGVMDPKLSARDRLTSVI